VTGIYEILRAILRHMIVVGLTGGIATGKSTVAGMFKRCGAVIIDADQLARDVVRRGKPAWREIVREFGDTVLSPNGSINRHALGTIVFHDRRKLRRLEDIIHPRVAREQQRLVRRIATRRPSAVVVYEVPLLFESGADKRVDKIIVVTADRETQIARLKRRNGLTRAEALRRINQQMPLDRKIRRADVVLNGTVHKTSMLRQVRRLMQHFRRADGHL
jgi:dephospho-CoA kinase